MQPDTLADIDETLEAIALALGRIADHLEHPVVQAPAETADPGEGYWRVEGDVPPSVDRYVQIRPRYPNNELAVWTLRPHAHSARPSQGYWAGGSSLSRFRAEYPHATFCPDHDRAGVFSDDDKPIERGRLVWTEIKTGWALVPVGGDGTRMPYRVREINRSGMHIATADTTQGALRAQNRPCESSKMARRLISQWARSDGFEVAAFAVPSDQDSAKPAIEDTEPAPVVVPLADVASELTKLFDRLKKACRATAGEERATYAIATCWVSDTIVAINGFVDKPAE